MWYFYTKDGLCRVNVRPVQQQRTKRLGPITVYRSISSGITYSQRYIKTWDELTAEQKKKAYRDAYQARREDAIWQCEKDNSLNSQFRGWIDELKAERDNAIAAIERGEKVDPPKHDWE